MLAELEIWVVFVLMGAGVFTIMLLIGNLIAAPAKLFKEQQDELEGLKSSGATAPDYVAWDTLNELEIRQAACLWAEIEPTGRDVPQGKPQIALHQLLLSNN